MPRTKRPTSSRRRSWWRYRAGKAVNRLSGDRLRSYAGGRHPEIVTRRIHCPNWPEQASGFRIGHLSDFHLGELLGVHDALRFLDEYEARLTQPLDMLLLTGDILDFRVDGCHPLLHALVNFPSKLGTWTVLGNHDVIVDREAFLDACRDAGLRMLINNGTVVQHHDRVPISLLGIDWGHRPRDLAAHVRTTVRRMADQLDGRNGASIMLAHHPRAFDFAAVAGIDLVLSGHTHGGQLNLAHPTTKRSAIGLGSLAHRYSWGVYERRSARLHVTSGVGSWFPFRVKCPSEMAVLEIVRSSRANPRLAV